MNKLAIPVLAAALVAFTAPAFAGEGGCGSLSDTQSVSIPQPVDTADQSTPAPAPTTKDESSG